MVNETRQIQLKCLEILDIVDDICRKNNIKYSLCGGSVVGAYLYQGCLPWDDDIDIMMTRENYNKFLMVAPQCMPIDFTIHNYQLTDEFSSLFTKIVNNKTTIVQQDGTVSGVFLDITVYDKIPENCLSKVDVLLWKISQVVFIGKISDVTFKAKLRNFFLSTVLIDKRRYFKFFQRCVEINGKCNNYHYSELFGAFCNTKPYDYQIFENYTEIIFEGKKYMVVRDYVKYLETRYDRKDFREPKENQKSPHYKFVDFNKPYKQYLKENSNG